MKNVDGGVTEFATLTWPSDRAVDAEFLHGKELSTRDVQHRLRMKPLPCKPALCFLEYDPVIDSIIVGTCLSLHVSFALVSLGVAREVAKLPDAVGSRVTQGAAA